MKHIFSQSTPTLPERGKETVRNAQVNWGLFVACFEENSNGGGSTIVTPAIVSLLPSTSYSLSGCLANLLFVATTCLAALI